MATPVVWNSGAPTTEGGGGGGVPSAWTVPSVGDLTVVCESGAGDFEVEGSDGTNGLPGVAGRRVAATCDGLAVLALPATLASGKRIALQVDWVAWGLSVFDSSGPGFMLAADMGGGSWAGPACSLDANNTTQIVQSRVTASATAIAFSDVAYLAFAAVKPRFVGFERDGSVVYHAWSVDGEHWIRGAAASTPTPDLTHIGLFVYNRGTAYTASRLAAYAVQDV